MNSSMRLKVKGDTFFLPDPNGGVYFRNNVGSFRMEGSEIDQWIEKLIPVFNGEYTMDDLTDGLPDPYRERVYEIAEVLHANGFVRDVSQDREHRLPEEVLRKYGSQIEFLDSFGGSGAYRFQSYRQGKVLAVGSGPFFVSLFSALLESGLAQFRMLITDPETTNRQRLSELAAHARTTDPEVEVEEVFLPEEGGMAWREVVRPFDSILYVSQDGNIEQLRAIHQACREEKKVLLPALIMGQAGMAGPLVHPDSDGCLESAWRRVHRSALSKDPELHAASSTSEAMLANVIVFEWLKSVTGVAQSELINKLYLLDLETMEGSWHSFLPHPQLNGRPSTEWVDAIDLPLEQGQGTKESNGLMPYFSRLTSSATGILHRWDEGELKQLPLCLCRVQAVDPLSEGPAELLPEIVCSGLTHEEARREAGLVGLEAYVLRMADLYVTKLPSLQGSGSQSQPFEYIGVGAGETVAEGVCRGLEKWLTEELGKQLKAGKPEVSRVNLSTVEDQTCRHYLNALTTMQGEPVIGLGEKVTGFPTVWVGTNGCWYGSVGLNRTSALRKALQQALLKAQNEEAFLTAQAAELPSVIVQDEVTQSITIHAVGEAEHPKTLQAALLILKRNQKRILVADLAFEPFMKEELAGAFGVSVQEEESP